jgi:hypothetical protein
MKAGDRVRLTKADADGWLLPWRNYALKGRVGIVASVWVRNGRKFAWVEFPSNRTKGRPPRMDFDLRFLEPAA